MRLINKVSDGEFQAAEVSADVEYEDSEWQTYGILYSSEYFDKPAGSSVEAFISVCVDDPMSFANTLTVY